MVAGWGRRKRDYDGASERGWDGGGAGPVREALYCDQKSVGYRVLPAGLLSYMPPGESSTLGLKKKGYLYRSVQ